MTEIELQNYAFDKPDKRDFKWSDYEELVSWEKSPRPKEKFKVQNQWNTPACTVFSAGHLHNGMNLLEDERLQEDRPQKELMKIRDLFCSERWYSNVGAIIQDVAKWFKNKWYIAWYVTLDWTGNKLIEQMKKALDMWNFISCGSGNGDWWETKRTWYYTVRWDWQFVWHAWCIVDYWDWFFRCINSYGDKRWQYNWYFKLRFEDIEKVYSKLCFIDKDDSGAFTKLADKERARQMIVLAKELYANWNNDVKKYFEDIQLSSNLKNLYKM